MLPFLLCQTVRAAQNRHFTIPLSEGSQSYMEVFLPDSAGLAAPMVVICPGGGYAHLALQHEGTEWAPFFNRLGIACAVVKYRMPEGNPSLPVSDAEKAVVTTRLNATGWNVDPARVGIMGFSAGGHLASTVATRSIGNARPDFQILFYPVITMENEDMHEGSTRNLLGDRADDAASRSMFSNYNNVTSDTPPAILLLSNDDTTVPPVGNSIAYYTALKRNGVDVTLHVYSKGGHGWGIRPKFVHHTQMLSDLTSWLAGHCLPLSEGNVF